MTHKECLSWLRYVLSPQQPTPVVSDWHTLFFFAEKHTIIGICNPTEHDVKMDIETLSLWIGSIEGIKRQSMKINKRVEELSLFLETSGFKCCILKGQGNAEMYPDPLLRMPGDIDVWVDADKLTVQKYVRVKYPDAETCYKHIIFPLFKDVTVDIHDTPLKLYYPIYNKRLQRWINKNKREQFGHEIRLAGTEKTISIPTIKFNLIFLLGHMLIHLYAQGIGLRHIVDYFYVLKNSNLTDEDCKEFEKTCSNFGMLKFARSVIWIEKEVLGLPVDHCIVTSYEKGGKQLIADILEGGNFGKYSQRYSNKKNFFKLGLIESRRLLSLSNLAPCEATACFVRKAGTVWKYIKENDIGFVFERSENMEQVAVLPHQSN